MPEPFTIDMTNIVNKYDNMSQTDCSDDIRKKDLYNNIILPNIKDNLKSLMADEKLYAKISNVCDIGKYLLLIAVPILALSAPQFIAYYALLSYLSGALSIGAIGLERTSKNFAQLSKAKSIKIREIMTNFHIPVQKTDMANSIDDINTPKTK